MPIRRRKFSEYLKEEIPLAHYHVEVANKDMKRPSSEVSLNREIASPSSENKLC